MRATLGTHKDSGQTCGAGQVNGARRVSIRCIALAGTSVGLVKSWLKFVSLSAVFLMWDIWGWLRRFAAERRRVSEPERSREAAQPTGRSRPVLTRMALR